MEQARPRIIVESNIPFVRGVLEPHASVSYLAPAEITPEAMRRADALITRTRTRCDASLLEGSPCRIIASATIGLDHVDLDYCSARGLRVVNAPGCNAPAVAQYVMAAVLAAYPESDLRSLTLGIVGVGHVGTIVDRWARSLGMSTLFCDPPRARVEGPEGFVGLDEVARRADIITFHTPYARSGADATLHLASHEFFAGLRRSPMIINSARGPIVDNAALLEAIEAGQVSRAVIDCWENEPRISLPLLEKAFIATPHIAGYSRQGKIRATAMAVAAVSREFGFPPLAPAVPLPPDAPDVVTPRAITSTYNPASDTEALRARPSAFEDLRNHYNLREEPA